MGNVSEDRLCFSIIELLHHLLDAHVVHDEEDESISLIPHDQRLKILMVQHRSKFFLQRELFLW